MSWSDVTFAEATWLLPSSDVGFVEMQAGCTLRGATPPPGHSNWWVHTASRHLSRYEHGSMSFHAVLSAAPLPPSV